MEKETEHFEIKIPIKFEEMATHSLVVDHSVKNQNEKMKGEVEYYLLVILH